jgi:hypothetical protein
VGRSIALAGEMIGSIKAASTRLLRVDTVEEQFLRGPRERLIQYPVPKRNLDSKIHARGFDFKI